MKNKLTFILLLFCIITTISFSQTGNLTGKIIIPDGTAIGATVILNNTQIGTVTDFDGKFTIKNIPVGNYEIIARLIGYEQPEIPTVKITEGETATITITLKLSAIQLQQVDITATRRQATEDMRTSVTTMTPREAKYLPGAAEDVLRSLQAMPGVLSVSDFSSQLVIRGSGPDQNLIAIDGFEVINPYRLYGFISMFNPETVSEISLQTGGFAAKYGDRLSAVLDVKNREGKIPGYIHGKINTSLTNANLVLEGEMPFKGSWLFSARRTYYDLVLEPFIKAAKLVEGDVALPSFTDFQFKGTAILDENNSLILNGLTSRDGAKLTSGAGRASADSVNFLDESFNSLAGLTWNYTPTKNIISQTRLSWYKNSGEGFFDGFFVDPAQRKDEQLSAQDTTIRLFNFGFNSKYSFTKYSLSNDIVWYVDKHTFDFGGGIDILNTQRMRTFKLDKLFQNILLSRQLVFPKDINADLTYWRSNIYASDRFQFSQNFYLQPGLRFDYYDALNKYYLSPRFALSYGIDELTTVRTAYGIYYQSPGMEKQDARAALDFTKETLRPLKPERADHYIFGIDRMLTSQWQIKFETYYKKFFDIIVAEKIAAEEWRSTQVSENIFSPSAWSTPQQVPTTRFTSTPVNDAQGQSYGFEFSLQKLQMASGEKLTGWLSYALSYAERERGGKITPFIFDQRHAINIVGNYLLSDSWEVGINFSLRSGKPFTEAVGVKPRLLIYTVNGMQQAVIDTVTEKGKVILEVEFEKDALSGRLNLYHTLDVRVTTYPKWWGLQWSIYLDITNIYNNKNEQQINYFVDDEGKLRQRKVFGLPIFPALGMSVVF